MTFKRHDAHPASESGPADPIKRAEAIARFTAVLERPDVRVELERLVRSLWPDQADGEMRVRALRGHAHRCTFEVTFGPDGNGPRVIAKAYDEDQSDVFAAMKAVVAAGFGPGMTFSIATPFAYLPSPRIFVQERVTGTEVVEIFRSDALDRQLEAAWRCGAWLGHFQTKAPPQGRVFGPDRLRFSIQYWAHELRFTGEPHASKALQLMRGLEAAAPGVLGEFDARASHGTYMPEHVVLSAARTVSIDIDEYRIADPAQDLAWFIISLQRMGLERRGSLRAHDRAVEELLRGYAASGPRSGISHLPFFKAALCLYEAHHDVYNRTTPLRELSEIMLDEGIDSLRWEPDRDGAQLPARSGNPSTDPSSLPAA